MSDRTITIRGIPDTVLEALKKTAAASRRSLNAQLLEILEAAAQPSVGAAVREPTLGYGGAAPADTTRSAGLDDNDLAQLTDICRRHHIRALAVYGSQVTGEARPDSDVDVVVDFEPGMTPGLGIVTVAAALRPAFGGRRVDLVTRRGLSPRLRERILATAVPLYAA